MLRMRDYAPHQRLRRNPRGLPVNLRQQAGAYHHLPLIYVSFNDTISQNFIGPQRTQQDRNQPLSEDRIVSYTYALIPNSCCHYHIYCLSHCIGAWFAQVLINRFRNSNLHSKIWFEPGWTPQGVCWHILLKKCVLRKLVSARACFCFSQFQWSFLLCSK